MLEQYFVKPATIDRLRSSSTNERLSAMMPA